MLGANELVLELGHLFLRAVEDAAEIAPQALVDSGTGDAREFLNRGLESFLERRCRYAYFLEQRSTDSVALGEEREEEMFVRDFLLIQRCRCILRSLEGFLHFLGELVDAHTSILGNVSDWARRRGSNPKNDSKMTP